MNMKKSLLFTLLLVGTVLSSFAQRSTQGLSAVLIPQYIPVGTPQNIAVYSRLRLSSLMPNTDYKYTVSLIPTSLKDTALLLAGEGRPIFVNSNNHFTFSYDNDFDTLSTNMMGEYEGWFGITSQGVTASAGDALYIGVSLINMMTSDTMLFYCLDSLTAIEYGTGSSDITGIYGSSYADTLNFVALYDNQNAYGRPLALTCVEGNDQSGNRLVNPPSYYGLNVLNKSKMWGAYIPNSLDSGVRAIVNYQPDGKPFYTNTDADGIWGPNKVNTVNPSGGTSAISLSSDDAPLIQPVIEFVSATSSTRENVASKDVVVVRKYSNSTDQKVTLVVSGGSADKNVDYTLSDSFEMVFTPGYMGYDTAVVNITNDALDEDREDITLRLINEVNCKIGSNRFHTISVTDDDTAMISFATNEVVLNEDAKSYNIPVKMMGAIADPIQVKMLVKSTGDSTYIPSEFKLSQTYYDTTFTLGSASGNDSLAIPVSIFDDLQADPDDTIVLALRISSTLGMVKDSLLTIIVKDNDGPSTITMVGTSLTVGEDVGEIEVKVRVVNKKDAGGDFALRYLTAESSATEGFDLTFNPISKLTSITSSTPDTIVFKVPVKDDDLFEGMENMKFGLISVSNVIIEKPDTFNVWVTDNDLPIYSIGTINKQTKSDGTVDSSGVRCRVYGVVYGINTRSTGLGFTIRDNTGGINVYSGSNTFNYTVKEGDSVMVQGRVSQFQGTAQMDNLDTIRRIISGKTISKPVVVSQISESAEANLVQLNRVKLVSEAEWPVDALNANSWAYVRVENTNGSIDTLNIDAETDIDGTPAPTGYFNVVGLGVQFDNKAPYFEKYYLSPRSINDFTDATLPEVKFSVTSDFVTELADSFIMTLRVSPSDENFKVDVVCLGGTAVEPTDYDFATKTINVIKNSNVYIVKANISDDTDADGDKELKFALRNINGPGKIGADSVITLTIQDNEASAIKTFVEGGIRLGNNPSTNGEFVLYLNNGMDYSKAIIYDLKGSVVFESELTNSGSHVLNTGLGQGIYTLTVVNSLGQQYSEKVSVK